MNIQFFMYAFIISIVVVFLVREFAKKINFTDKPDKRKLHGEPKPLMGGLALFISGTIAYTIYLGFDIDSNTLISWLLALSIVIMGLVDDKIDLKPIVKLALQVIIAYLTAAHLGGVSQIDLFGHHILLNDVMSTLVPTIWIVALINAFNLIDGLDGLSAGGGLFSLVTLIIMSTISQDVTNVVFLYIMCGTLLGFLFYNFYPSTIFMGDAGAMLLGYLIAILSMGEYKSVTLSSLMLVFLIAFLPMLDAILSFIRRKINGEKIYKADALHFHNRLMRKGFSHQGAVMIMYVFMLIYVCLAVAYALIDPHYYFIVYIAVFIVTDVLIERYYLLSRKHTYVYNFLCKITRRPNEK